MRHSVRARFLQTLVCAGCALGLPGSAMAADASPVHIDPSSPVAKEYALPLATARGAPAESGQSGKLFGSGIKQASSTAKHASSTTTPTGAVDTVPTVPAQAPPAPAQSEQAATTTATSPATTTTAATTVPAATATTPRTQKPLHHPQHVPTVTLTRTTPTIQASASATPAAYRVLRPGSSSGLLWMALAAVLVVVLGSAGGLALRRRR